MKIACICGSVRKGSKTKEFLSLISSTFKSYHFETLDIASLPMFHPDLKDNAVPENVIHFIKAINKADAVIFITPEYLHNIPAVLKSALEWTTESGVLCRKPSLALVYTPSPTRGKKAMQSLLLSLGALDCHTVASMNIYHTDLDSEHNIAIGSGLHELLKEGLSLLTN